MEFIHHYLVDVCLSAVAQGDVRDDFRSRGDDRCVAVYGGITGHHADVFWAEDFTQREELLTYQRLNRSGVEGTLSTRHGYKVRSVGNHGFTRAGWGRKNNVVTGEQG